MPYVSAIVGFGGTDPNVDVDRAAFELERAGYKVHHCLSSHPVETIYDLDLWLVAIIEVDATHVDDDDERIDAIGERVDAIVTGYGGAVTECGLLDE
jgi:hypothetical protein